MGALNNLYVSSSFQGLMKLTNSATGLTNSLQTIQAGDGSDSPLQMSKTEVNISGSLTVNGQPISVATGSFATTGSNTFIGNQTIVGNVTFPSSSFISSDNVSGALYLSSLNQGTLYLNGDGGEGDVVIGYSAWQNNLKVKGGNTEITGSLGVTNIKGTGSLLLQPNQSDARYLEIYNTSPTDTHITGSGGQIFIGDDVTYVKVDNYGSVKRIDIVADNLINVSGSMNVTGSIDITGQYLVNGVAFSGGTNGSSGTSGSNGTDGTSGSNGTDGTSGTNGTSGSNGTNGSSGTSGLTDKTGLITTGSLGTSQGISGSLNLFGGNTLFQQTGQTISNQVTQSVGGANILFGLSVVAAGYLETDYTGSLTISGSNNITPSLLLNPFDISTAPTGDYKWFISGSNNILNAVNGGAGLALNNSAVAKPGFNSNIGQGNMAVTLTSSSLAQPVFSNNLLLANSTQNFSSGSVNFTSNILAAGLTSTQNYTPGKSRPTIQNNIISAGVTLNHISSSISYTNNIGGGLTINNHVSSSFSNATNGISLVSNTIGGTQNIIYASGSASSAQTRVFSNNFIGGNGNIISSSYVGSNNTHLFSNIIFGQSLNVSGSNSATSGGSAFFGRFNATGSNQESSQETVFVVGTGTGAGSRRNALRIDNNNNSNFTGSVIISGSIFNRGGGNISSNLCYGEGPLLANTTGASNTAIGASSLSTNISGSNNTAVGANSLLNNKASFNLALGTDALRNNTTGQYNNAIGDAAMYQNTIGNSNVAIGKNTMFANVSGSTNVAIGQGAMASSVSGSRNMAIGASSLSNVNSNNNTGIGNEALQNLTT
jgi:hypothetical protein